MVCHRIILYRVVNNYTFSVARYVESRASFWRNHVIAHLLHFVCASVTGGDLPCDDCALVSTLMGAVCPTECAQVPFSHPWRSTQQQLLGRCISQLRKCRETRSNAQRQKVRLGGNKVDYWKIYGRRTVYAVTDTDLWWHWRRCVRTANVLIIRIN